jgi:hypothetical protein
MKFKVGDRVRYIHKFPKSLRGRTGIVINSDMCFITVGWEIGVEEAYDLMWEDGFKPETGSWCYANELELAKKEVLVYKRKGGGMSGKNSR